MIGKPSWKWNKTCLVILASCGCREKKKKETEFVPFPFIQLHLAGGPLINKTNLCHQCQPIFLFLNLSLSYYFFHFSELTSTLFLIIFGLFLETISIYIFFFLQSIPWTLDTLLISLDKLSIITNVSLNFTYNYQGGAEHFLGWSTFKNLTK